MRASNEGLRVADESNALAESGAAGLRKILAGCRRDDRAGRRRSPRATDEQQAAGAERRRPPCGRRRSRRGWWRRPPRSRRRPPARSSRRHGPDAEDRAGGDQGGRRAGPRGARHHQGGAEHAPSSPSQVRKATAEQAKSARQIIQAVDSMRRGAATTSRAVGEQATATEESPARRTRSRDRRCSCPAACRSRRWPQRRSRPR